MNAATLLTLARIEASRAGLELRGEDREALELVGEGATEIVSLGEACWVLASLRGSRCNPHVMAQANRIRVIMEKEDAS